MKGVVACALLVLLGSGSLAAQNAVVPDKLTLADALRLAAERNPLFLAAQNQVEIAVAGRTEATLKLNPALTVESSGYPLREPNRAPFFNDQELLIRIDREIEPSGRRGLRIERAQGAVAVAESQRRDRLRQLELELRRTYFQMVLAQADRGVAQTALGDIDQVIALNRARMQQGEIAGAELRRLQVERLRFVDDVFAAELALRNARSALLALLNVFDLGQPFDVTEPLEPPADALRIGTLAIGIDPKTPIDGTALLEQAIGSRPDLMAARQEQDRADTETRLQHALRTPNITVGGGYKRDFGTNAVVFGATVPLPLSNRNQGGIARAEAERRRAENHLAAATTAVRLDVQQAVNALEINRQRVDYIRREYLTTAGQSRDIVLASYRLGEANLIDFLDAQRAFRDTQRTYNRALYEERLSLFQMAAAIGAPSGQP
jgi:cobalt-zinc-cadmium efflux system outer membrane protein